MACSECGDKKTCQACVMESALLAMRDITREKIARECAEIVAKVAADMQVPEDEEDAAEHFLLVARRAILRKFGIEGAK